MSRKSLSSRTDGSRTTPSNNLRLKNSARDLKVLMNEIEAIDARLTRISVGGNTNDAFMPGSDESKAIKELDSKVKMMERDLHGHEQAHEISGENTSTVGGGSSSKRARSKDKRRSSSLPRRGRVSQKGDGNQGQRSQSVGKQQKGKTDGMGLFMSIISRGGKRGKAGSTSEANNAVEPTLQSKPLTPTPSATGSSAETVETTTPESAPRKPLAQPNPPAATRKLSSAASPLTSPAEQTDSVEIRNARGAVAGSSESDAVLKPSPVSSFEVRDTEKIHPSRDQTHQLPLAQTARSESKTLSVGKRTKLDKIHELKSLNKELRKANKNLQEDLCRAEAKATQMEGSWDAFNSNLRQLLVDLENERTDNAKLAEELRAANQKNELLTEELHEALKSIERLESEQRGNRAEIKILHGEVASVSEEVAVASKEVLQLECELKEKKTELKNKSVEINMLRDEVLETRSLASGCSSSSRWSGGGSVSIGGGSIEIKREYGRDSQPRPKRDQRSLAIQRSFRDLGKKG